jgi:CheY-like chemotaxis protein
MSKKKILVVDDEDDIRYVLKRFLEDEEYEVIEAEGGPQCLKIIEKNRPDLIILDILMPEMNGWDVSRKIKQNKSTKDIPVSMLSILSDTRDKTKRIRYGRANTHLSKPIDFDILSKTVKNLIEKYSRTSKKPPKPPKRPPIDGELNDFYTPFSFDSAFNN